MKRNYLLNKSTLIWSKRCEKAAWLYVHNPELRDGISDLRRALFSRGVRIGNLARQLYPQGVDVSVNVKLGSNEHIMTTQKAMEEGIDVLFEAAFSSNGCVCIADIIVKTNDAWDVYEVKSGVAINESHYLDLSFQYMVMIDAGLQINELFFIYINSDYIRKDKLNPERLFVKKNYTKRCKKSLSRIRRLTLELKEKLAERSPEKEFGSYCLSPSPCDFYENCWGHFPQPSVVDLSGVHMHKKVSWIQKGIHLAHDIPEEDITPAMQIAISSLKDGLIVIDKEKLNTFLSGLSYPLYFIDFETFQSPVPLFKDSKPNQLIPVQYSVHVIKGENSEVEHSDFLASTGQDPVEEFVSSLLNKLGDSGSILVYNQSFESSVLRKLKDKLPQHADAIDAIVSRMVDLMVPFREKSLYHPSTMGSYSIKYILPAFVDHIGYSQMKVANGAMATMAFENMIYSNDESEIQDIRDSLLEYCKMDTYAMILLLDVIRKYANQ